MAKCLQKSQYVNHVEHESHILKSFPKEIASTGIDIKSLVSSELGVVSVQLIIAVIIAN